MIGKIEKKQLSPGFKAEIDGINASSSDRVNRNLLINGDFWGCYWEAGSEIY